MPRTSYVVAQRFRRLTSQLQRTGERVAARRHQMMARGVRQPWLDRCGKTADERQTIRSEIDEYPRQCVDMAAGKTQ